ncbi:MAG: DUF4397 domain-containing protein [Flavobacteriales bacterium]|nr:DUF4397 domain-containing protein [Flavobacteriales bacterium]
MRQKRTLTWMTAFLTSTLLLAQTARVQVIHNSADAAAAQVDVYINGALAIDDFAFRTATPFIDLPAGVDLTVGIAPGNSSGAQDVIANFNYNLPDGGTFVLVANGIVSPAGHSPATPFDIYVAEGRETAQGPGTDVLVFHGSTDAPTVDVYEAAVVNGTLIDDLAYGDFAGYLEVPTADFTLQVRTADNSAIVAAYTAPLAALGLNGAAVTVVASGFLDPANNNNGPGFGLYVALPSGGPLVALPAAATPAPARVQVIHNSADAAAASVDVYINGALAVNDFGFRTATPFIDLPSTVDLTVGIAPGNSTGPQDVIANFNYNLPEGGTFVLVANGIVSPAGYNPTIPFDIYVSAGRENAQGPGTDVLVFHGSTDAPTVDVYEAAVVNGTLIDDLAYGEFAGYLEVPTADFTLQVRTADNSAIVAAYAAPLASLGLNGAALTVVASGFLDPANNNGGAGFGLFVALPSGGPLVALPAAATPAPARVQVVHNSADAAAALVDVYVNGALAVNDFAFRTATPFIDLPSTVDLTVGIAPGNSSGPQDAIANFSYNLPAGGTFVLVANGIVSPAGYNPAIPFDIYVSTGRETAQGTGTDVLVFHGSTDAPTVQVAETALLGGALLVQDLSYGDFDGYLEVPTNDYVLQVQLPDGTPVVSYQAPLSTLGLQGAALTVLASGFLNPANNSNGAEFGLWVALPAGGPLVALPLSTGIDDAADLLNGLQVWPNPANDRLFIDLDATASAQARIELTDSRGRIVRTVDGSIARGDSRVEMDVNGLANGTYILRVLANDTARAMPVNIVR